MFRHERKIFMNNYTNIQKYEKDYVELRKLVENKRKYDNCKKMYKSYINKCDNIDVLFSIDLFYDNDFYDIWNKKINDINDYMQVKAIITDLNHFKNILNIVDIIDNDLDIKISECIEERIKYKYECVLPEKRDKGHDMEILRLIFYQRKYNDLQELFNNIQQRYKFLREKREQQKNEDRCQRRKKEEEARKKEEEARIEAERLEDEEDFADDMKFIEIMTSKSKLSQSNSSENKSDNISSEFFEKVLPKKQKRNRKRH